MMRFIALLMLAGNAYAAAATVDNTMTLNSASTQDVCSHTLLAIAVCITASPTLCQMMVRAVLSRYSTLIGARGAPQNPSRSVSNTIAHWSFGPHL